MVVLLPSESDGSASIPTSVRIKSVSASGFQALILVPPGPTGNRSDTAVSYMAVMPGVHSLPNGHVIQAGLQDISARQIGKSCQAQGVVQGWDKVRFPMPFSATPSVVANLQTANNEQGAVPRFFSKPWFTLACNAASKTEISVALESAETSKVGDVTSTEQVGYVAMETGQGGFDSELGPIKYSAVLTGTVVKGVDDGATEVGFGGDLMTNSPLVVGSQSSREGENGGWLRMSASSSSSVHVFIDEDVYCDREREHIGEMVSIIAWSSAFFLRPATTTTSTTRSFMGTPGLEVGVMTLRSGEWTDVSFGAAFAEAPVVVAAPSGEGSSPAAIRLKGITSLGFQATVATPISNAGNAGAGGPIVMTVSFIAMPPGVSQLQGQALSLT